MCQMFSSSTEEKVKNEILSSFTDPQSSLRVIVATIAFGMGLDASDVESIIHYGPSDSIEAYLQETGRCGHDGRDSSATLYYRKRDVASNSPVSDSMKLYCGNYWFLSAKVAHACLQFEIVSPMPMHKCCDICERECLCETCSHS